MNMNRDLVLEVIANLIKGDSMPEVTFREGTPIQSIVQSFALTCTRDPEANDVEAANKWVEDMMSFESKMLDEQIREISDALVAGIEGSAETIKSIHAIVESLVTKIDDQVDNGIKLNPTLSKLVVTKNTEVEYQSMDFAALSAFGTGSIIGEMRSFVGAENSGDSSAYRSVMDRYIQMKASAEPVGITIGPEDKAAIVSAVNDKSSAWDEDDVREAINIITNPSRISGMLTAHRRRAENKVNYTNDMVEALTMIGRFGELVPALQDTLAEMNYNVAANAGRVIATMEAGYYFVDYHRKNTYADTVVFSNGLFNPDAKATMDAEGVSLDDVAKHQAVIWPNGIVVATGITINAVKNAKDRITKQFAEGKAADESYCSRELKSLQSRAFLRVSSEYFNDIGIDADSYLHTKADRLLVEDTPIEDVLFSAIVAHQYSGSVVGTIHNILGKAYTEAVKDNPEVSKAAINDLTLDAYLEVVTSILAKQIVV